MGVCVSKTSGALAKENRKKSCSRTSQFSHNKLDDNALPPKPQNPRTPSRSAAAKHNTTPHTPTNKPNAQIPAICFWEKGNSEDKIKQVESSSSGCSTFLTAQQILHFIYSCILQKHFCILRDTYYKSVSISHFTNHPSGSPWFLSSFSPLSYFEWQHLSYSQSP